MGNISHACVLGAGMFILKLTLGKNFERSRLVLVID
jgi:hypothetical protein